MISGYALAWIAVAARTGAVEFAKRGAAVALFGSELTALVAALPSERFLSSGAAAAPFALLLAVHVANVAVLLALTMQGRWPWVATGVLVVVVVRRGAVAVASRGGVATAARARRHPLRALHRLRPDRGPAAARAP